MNVCPCCMEKHPPQIITVTENNVFKNLPVAYIAEYYYCPITEETYANEQQILANNVAMKNAYCKTMEASEN